MPRQIDAYNLHILRRASHPVLWRGCLGRMGLPPWLVHATSLTGRYALNMEVAAERNYAQLLLAEQANRMYDAAGPTPAWRSQAVRPCLPSARLGLSAVPGTATTGAQYQTVLKQSRHPPRHQKHIACHKAACYRIYM